MDGIDKAIAKLVTTKENQNRYYIYKLRANWERVIGRVNAKHCQPIRLERRVLLLQADSSTWANQFMFFKKTLIEKINSYLCRDEVKEVKYTVNSQFRNIGHPKVAKGPEPLRLPDISEQEIEALRERLSYITQPQIREKALAVEIKRAGLEKLYEQGKIKKCSDCGTFIEDDLSLCPNCQRKRKEERRANIAAILVKEPWLKYQDLQKKLKCDKIEFNSVKDSLQGFYFDRVKRGFASEEEKLLAVLFITGKRQSELKADEYENVLGYLGERKKNVRSFRSKLHNQK